MSHWMSHDGVCIKCYSLATSEKSQKSTEKSHFLFIHSIHCVCVEILLILLYMLMHISCYHLSCMQLCLPAVYLFFSRNSALLVSMLVGCANDLLMRNSSRAKEKRPKKDCGGERLRRVADSNNTLPRNAPNLFSLLKNALNALWILENWWCDSKSCKKSPESIRQKETIQRMWKHQRVYSHFANVIAFSPPTMLQQCRRNETHFFWFAQVIEVACIYCSLCDKGFFLLHSSYCYYQCWHLHLSWHKRRGW